MKNARIQRWAIMLEEYGCDIKYKSGKLNIPADILSRIVAPLAVQTNMNTDVQDSTSGLKATNDLEGEYFNEKLSPEETLHQRLNQNLSQLQDEVAYIKEIK